MGMHWSGHSGNSVKNKINRRLGEVEEGWQAINLGQDKWTEVRIRIGFIMPISIRNNNNHRSTQYKNFHILCLFQAQEMWNQEKDFQN